VAFYFVAIFWYTLPKGIKIFNLYHNSSVQKTSIYLYLFSDNSFKRFLGLFLINTVRKIVRELKCTEIINLYFLLTRNGGKMKLGYARVSTDDQDMLMQIEALKAAGVKEDNIFKEHVSGMKKERPELKRMLEYAREGDEIIVFKLDRISRSLKHLEELVEEFEIRGIEFGAIAEFERDIISERTKEQLAAKKKNGIKLGRPVVDNEKLEMAFALHDSKRYSVKEITEKVGLSRTTFYDYLKNRPAK